MPEGSSGAPSGRDGADVLAGEAVVVEAMKTLDRVPTDTCGALVRKRRDGAMVGAMLVEDGRVCWVVCNDNSRRLTDLLIEESETLTEEQVTAVVARCRREHRPLGETLIAEGLVSLPMLHRALLAHSCEALEALLKAEAEPWTWVPHSNRSYNPMLTFSPTELLAALFARAQPARAAAAAAALQAMAGPRMRAFAIERVAGGRIPLAQHGCDDVDLATLRQVSEHVDEIFAVAATAKLHTAIVELSAWSAAAVTRGNTRYVLLLDGELAFNRLVSHVTTLRLDDPDAAR